jgi:hypothetical protein
MIFAIYAEKLLPIVANLTKEDSYYHYASADGKRFGFRHQRDYSGKMANPKLKRFTEGKTQLGLFDIFVVTEGRYEGKSVSHRMVFQDLKTHSSEEACLRVWRGEDPLLVGGSVDEKEALTVMSLLMFEQEVNWGGEVFQKWTHFSPKVTKPCKIRPRDMMMGFIRQAFSLPSLDEIKYWQIISGDATPTFRDPDRQYSDFKSYPADYKRFFTELEGMNGTEALMVGARRNAFRQVAESCGLNPRYSATEKGFYRRTS